MQETEADEGFWDLVDEFVSLANRQCEQGNGDKVSAALLYASARFNAYAIASEVESAAELGEEKAAAQQYFTQQYQQMFEQNVDDYQQNFDDYINGA